VERERTRSLIPSVGTEIVRNGTLTRSSARIAASNRRLCPRPAPVLAQLPLLIHGGHVVARPANGAQGHAAQVEALPDDQERAARAHEILQ
jgi:hypothetical protein